MFVTEAVREIAAFIEAPLPPRPDPCTCRAGHPFCDACVRWEEARRGEATRGKRILGLNDLHVRMTQAQEFLRCARAAGDRARAVNLYNQLRRYRKRLQLIEGQLRAKY